MSVLCVGGGESSCYDPHHNEHVCTEGSFIYAFLPTGGTDVKVCCGGGGGGWGQHCVHVCVMGGYVTWTFLPNNNGIAHQGRAG
jgi:hypothetical protein